MNAVVFHEQLCLARPTGACNKKPCSGMFGSDYTMRRWRCPAVCLCVYVFVSLSCKRIRVVQAPRSHSPRAVMMPALVVAVCVICRHLGGQCERDSTYVNYSHVPFVLSTGRPHSRRSCNPPLNRRRPVNRARDMHSPDLVVR